MMKSWLFGLCLIGFTAGTAQAADTLQATIAWKNVDTTRKIHLEKGPTATGPFTILADLEANTTSYVDATNAPGSKACYRMAYFDESRLGPFSTPKCRTFTTVATNRPGVVTVK